jgi:hypothetical protein
MKEGTSTVRRLILCARAAPVALNLLRYTVPDISSLPLGLNNKSQAIDPSPTVPYLPSNGKPCEKTQVEKKRRRRRREVIKHGGAHTNAGEPVRGKVSYESRAVSCSVLQFRG